MKSSGSIASSISSSTGSCPIGVIEILLPLANGPNSSMCSISAFQSAHRGTSAHSRQIASAEAVVSMLSSVHHMLVLSVRLRARHADCVCTLIAESGCAGIRAAATMAPASATAAATRQAMENPSKNALEAA
jgi:hypothetical protein